MRLEHELLLRCATARLDVAEAARVHAIVSEPLDWTMVETLAEQHWVTPLLGWHLQGLAGVPPVFADRLRTNAVWCVRATAHLIALQQDADARRLDIAAWKGPTLAALAYGHIALRRFSDLDLLIRRGDRDRVAELLVARGFECAPAMFGTGERLFVQPRAGIAVEIRWSAAPGSFARDLGIDRLRCERTAIGERTVVTPCPADLLVMLCVHGTGHRWERLQWIADVAALVRASPALDWRRADDLARQSGALRMMYLGLCLAGDLLRAPLPADVRQLIDRDRIARRLADDVTRRFYASGAADAEVSASRVRAGRFAFQLCAQDRIGDRCRHAIRASAVRSAWTATRLARLAGVLT